MAKLFNKTKNMLVCSNLNTANSFTSRLIGLMGKTNFASNQCLWISNCNSIHTFFMKFDIDVVFVDKNMKVKRVYRGLKPWRLPMPVFGAKSVFEFKSDSWPVGTIETGDQLYVGD